MILCDVGMADMDFKNLQVLFLYQLQFLSLSIHLRKDVSNFWTLELAYRKLLLKYCIWINLKDLKRNRIKTQGQQHFFEGESEI